MGAELNLALIISAIDRLSAPVKKMTGALDGFNKVAQRGAQISAIGDGLSRAGIYAQNAGAQMRGAIAGIMAPAVALQDSAAAIRSLPGQSAESLKQFTDDARAYSRQHAITADAMMRTNYRMLSAGLDNTAAMAATRTSASVAIATMGDAAETADMLSTVYLNLGDRSKDASAEIARIGDVLAKTQQVYKLKNMDQLVEGINEASASAVQFRMEMPQMAAVIGSLNDAGLMGSRAGSSFKATMAAISEASQKLNFDIARNAQGGVDLIGTIENIEKRYGKLTNLGVKDQVLFKQAFGGTEGLAGLVLLSKNIDDVKTKYRAISDSAGAAAAAQAIMEEGPSKQYEIMTNNINDFKITVATQLLPMLTSVIPVIKSIVDKAAAFATAHPGIVKVAAGFALVAAGVLTVVAPILGVAGSLMMIVGQGAQFIALMPGLLGGMSAMVGGAAGLSGAMYALGAAAAVVGAAFAGWKIGRWISDVTGLTDAIATAHDETAKLNAEAWKTQGAQIEKKYGVSMDAAAVAAFMRVDKSQRKGILDAAKAAGRSTLTAKDIQAATPKAAPTPAPTARLARAARAATVAGAIALGPAGAAAQPMPVAKAAPSMAVAAPGPITLAPPASASAQAPALTGGATSGGAGGRVLVQQTNTYHITIQAQPGQDVKALADVVMREIRARGARDAREALHDAL